MRITLGDIIDGLIWNLGERWANWFYEPGLNGVQWRHVCEWCRLVCIARQRRWHCRKLRWFCSDYCYGMWCGKKTTHYMAMQAKERFDKGLVDQAWERKR